MQATGTHSKDIPVYDSGTIRFQSLFELKELWRYRYLVTNLVSRDLKVRYKRSILGFIWVMLNPLLTMLVMVIVFSNLLRYTVNHYPIYLLTGILIFGLFGQGTIAAMSNLLGNGNTLRRMYVPPSVFVTSSIGSALVNLAFSIVPFFLVAIVTGVYPTWTWFFILVPCVEVSIFALGVGLIVAPMMVFFHDTYEIYSVLVTVMNYLTPVFYPITVFRNLPIMLTFEKYNPLYMYMDIARSAIAGSYAGYNPLSADTRELILAPVMAVGMFIIGWLFFTRLEDRFAYHF